ncbi:MAG TPA: class I SAM-dependent methyltransferase [Gaiellales bacterium]|nr:class I SAM-dependent methyltransferase [Gaiellales bacterium]
MAPQERSRTAPGERWLASLLPFVRAQLPPAPARVIEIGCGTLGGFVPALLGDGYDATGVDPKAPEAAAYRRTRFEDCEPGEPADVIVACRSLHHVADLDEIAGRAAGALRPGGTIVVVEWAWERLDEQSARWCFERLETIPPVEAGWLHRRRDGWLASGETWEAYFAGWAAKESLHRSDEVVTALDARFARRLLEYGPYLLVDLADDTEAEEQAAIDAGTIRGTGIRYAGTLL